VFNLLNKNHKAPFLKEQIVSDTYKYLFFKTGIYTCNFMIVKL